MRYEDDDYFYTYYYPVRNHEEALMYSNRNGMTGESEYIGNYIKLINLQWEWNKNAECDE